MAKQVAIMAVLLAAASGAMGQMFVGVHCGSDEPLTSPRGDVFSADLPYDAERGYGYIGGETPASYFYELIGGREDVEGLYRKVREGEFSYRFDLPNGLYAVKVMMGDLIMHGPGFRSIYVIAEGDTVIRNLDLCAEVGHAFAYPVRFATEVNDGQLNLEFGSLLDGATCSAIAVREIEEDGEPPVTPEGFTAIGGYEANILYWDFSTAEDLGGYRVYRRSGAGEWEQVTNDPYPHYRYLDFAVEEGAAYEYRVTAVDLWGNESEPSETASATAILNSSTELVRMQVFVDDENLYELNSAYWMEEYVDAGFIAEGESFPNSGLRYRGNYTRNLAKKNYKIKLPDGQEFDGQDRINLAAEMIDFTMLKNRVSTRTYDLLTELNPRTHDVHLEINGEFRGAYLQMEEVDNHFLESRGLSTAGNLYQGESGLWQLASIEEYQEHYIKQNNEGTNWSDIIEFATWVDTSSAGQFLCKAGHRFAVDQFLNMYVGLIATAEHDWGGHNYYLYRNPVDRKWYFVPWDHNSSLGDSDSPIDLFTHDQPSPIAGHMNRLVERLLAEPYYRYAYCKKLERFLEGEFSVERVAERIQESYDAIYFDAERDVYKNGWERIQNVQYGRDALNNFVAARVPYLLGEIPGFISNPDRALAFRLNEMTAANVATIQDEHGDYDPWVEVVNISPVEMDLGGFTLTFGNETWTLTEDVVAPAAGRLLLWIDGEPAEGQHHASFVLSNAGGEIRLASEQGTCSDSTIVPVLSEDESWARIWDIWGQWQDDLEPTPGEPNSPPADPSLLRINELLSLNNHTLPDEAGEFEDWVEIYNPANYAIPMVGLFLSDNPAQPTTWAFPDTLLPAGGYMIVWCDEEPEDGPFHATFRLSGGGDVVFLTDRDCTTPIDNVQFPAQMPDRSWGRFPDGEANWVRMDPTPGEPNVVLIVDEPTAAEVPASFALHQNYPNPFNPTTTIRFELAQRGIARLTVFDVTGRTVATLVNGELAAGEHSVLWNAENAASGIYFYRLQTAGFIEARKMAVIK